MKNLKHLLSYLCLSLGMLICFTQAINAQTTKQATGTITDETGEPVVGASVIVKENSTVGTVSDIEGKFDLSNIPSSATTLIIRYIGYTEQEVAIGKDLKIVLVPSVSELDEVIVVAYGTTKKAAFTGSATQISGEKITAKNQSEITKALAGEVAGVQVINTSGQPGTNATVRIRGYGSANSSRAPLYVVDGMPYEGDISAIPNSDVESTTVLKDASAAALYGARASNGVILITTKKGKSGTSYIDVDAHTGINTRIIPLYDVIDSPERYAELAWESKKNYALLSGLSPFAANLYASNSLFDPKQSGISSIYNMWNAPNNYVVDAATGKITAPRKYTPEKWSDYMFGTGQRHEASIKFSGGSGNTLSYYTSFGVLDEEGYYIQSDYSRLSARTNLVYEPKKWLKATTNLSYAYQELNNPSQTDNMNNGFQFVNFMPPIYPVFQRDSKGQYVPDPIVGGNRYDFGMESNYSRGYAAGINPVMIAALDVNRSLSHQLIGNANFEVKFLDDFKFTTSNGYQLYIGQGIGLENPYYGDAAGVGRITRTTETYTSLNLTQMLSYQKKINLHSINAFVAHETYNLIYHVDYAQQKTLAMADGIELSNGISMNGIYGFKLDRSMESYFAQAKYDYDEKYFIDFNVRRDGSSRFTNNKWGNFWSAGAAWLLHKENFMRDLDEINHLRLKVSYGTNGNEGLAIGTQENFYPTQNLYSINNLNDELSYSIGYIGNPELTWEKSNMLNAGVDFGIWDDRLEGEIEVYRKRTTDMIFSKQMPTSLGYSSLTVNDAVLDNTGIEITIKGKVVKTEDLEIELNANAAHYTNKMVTMPLGDGNKPKAIEVHGNMAWAKGHSLYDYYMREYAGVDPNDGAAQWISYYDRKNPDGMDENNNPTYTIVDNMVDYLDKRQRDGKEVDLVKDVTKKYQDATLMFNDKSAIPDLAGAFGFNVKFKGIELSAQALYSVGGYGYDAVYATAMHNGVAGSMNWHKDIEQRWTEPGQITSVPRLSASWTSSDSEQNDAQFNSTSTRFLTSRDYLGLNNVRLAYNFPKRLLDKLKIEKSSIWISGDNLYISTARKGYFPVGSESGASDRSQYIPLTTIMAGVHIQF